MVYADDSKSSLARGGGSSPLPGTMKSKSPFILRVDENITLRIRTKRDAKEVFNLVQENRKHLSKFLD